MRTRPGRGGRAEPFGAALMLSADELLEDLWQGEIDWIRLPDGSSVEMFLDRLAFEAAQPSYLLDPRFEGLLDDGQRELRRLLLPLVEARRGSAPETAAWPLVEDLLGKLGAFGSGSDRESS